MAVGEPAEGVDEVLGADVVPNLSGPGTRVQNELHHPRGEYSEKVRGQRQVGRIAGVRRRRETTLVATKRASRSDHSRNASRGGWAAASRSPPPCGVGR